MFLIFINLLIHKYIVDCGEETCLYDLSLDVAYYAAEEITEEDKSEFDAAVLDWIVEKYNAAASSSSIDVVKHIEIGKVQALDEFEMNGKKDFDINIMFIVLGVAAVGLAFYVHRRGKSRIKKDSIPEQSSLYQELLNMLKFDVSDQSVEVNQFPIKNQELNGV